MHLYLKDASGDKQGGVVNYERFQFHKYCVDLAMKTDKNVVELISSKHEKQKLTVLTCIKC